MSVRRLLMHLPRCWRNSQTSQWQPSKACPQHRILRVEGSFNDEEMRVIWNALGLYISRNLRMGRGINIPKFGIFTFTPPEVRLKVQYNVNVGSYKLKLTRQETKTSSIPNSKRFRQRTPPQDRSFLPSRVWNGLTTIYVTWDNWRRPNHQNEYFVDSLVRQHKQRSSPIRCKQNNQIHFWEISFKAKYQYWDP